MKKNTIKYSLVFAVVFILSAGLFYWFIKSEYFYDVNVWVSGNKALYIFFLLIFKSIGILWPPIPAGFLTLGSIPFLGWQLAYLIDLVGSIIGGSISYYLGKKYGLVLLKKLFDQKILDAIQKIKIKKGKEVEAVFVYRVLLGTTIIEAVYYGAGLLKVNFRKFLLGAVLSHIAVGVPTFVFTQNILSGKNIVLTIVSIAASVYLVYKTKGRYLE